jgi:hypothetical protein
MQRFMQEKNLTLFLKRLLDEQKDMDEERRQVIYTLLAERPAVLRPFKSSLTDRLLAARAFASAQSSGKR